ncbi:MAG: MAPEG family protein [Parvularculaceae bacterium]
MGIELLILLGMCVYGAVQALLTGVGATIQQIHRNFSETFFLFGASVLTLEFLNGFGPWSLKGAAAYAVGRALYLAMSVKPMRPLRRWAWAVSIAGIVGCLAELARAIIG